MQSQEQQQPAMKKAKKEKKVRKMDPNKMTYIKAFSIWRQKQNPVYQGLSPKKGSDQYLEIMKILQDGK